MATSRAKKSTPPTLYAIYVKWRQANGNLREALWHADGNIFLKSTKEELSTVVGDLKRLKYDAVEIVEIKGIPS